MEPEDKELIEGKSIEEQVRIEGEVPDEQKLMTRRQFLTKLSLALGGVGTAIVGLPIVGFLFAPLFNKPPEIWRPVGPVDQFKIGETVEVSFLDASPLPWAARALSFALVIN